MQSTAEFMRMLKHLLLKLAVTNQCQELWDNNHQGQIPLYSHQPNIGVTVSVPFVDAILSEMETRFSVEKRAHFELCTLMPQVIIKKDNLEETAKILTSKWKHLLPVEDNFDSELSRWKQHCNCIPDEKSLTCLLSEDADPIFFS